MKYGNLYTKHASLLGAFGIGIVVFLSITACTKIANRYAMVTDNASGQMYAFGDPNVAYQSSNANHVCLTSSSINTQNIFHKQCKTCMDVALKCDQCMKVIFNYFFEKNDNKSIKYIKWIKYIADDANINTFERILEYDICIMNSLDNKKQKKAAIFFHEVLSELLDSLLIRCPSSTEPNGSYDASSRVVLDRVICLFQILRSSLQSYEISSENSNCSDRLERLKSAIKKHIFEGTRFKKILLSGANMGHLTIIDTCLIAILNISGPEQHFKMLCEPLTFSSNNSNNSYNTLLGRAVLNGGPDSIKMIFCLVNHLENNPNLLLESIQPWIMHIKSYFLDQPVKCGGDKYQTPLHVAVKNNNIDQVGYLLKLGANPNIQDNLGQTPLHIASKSGSIEIIESLLKFSANPNIEDKSRKPAFTRDLIIKRALNLNLLHCRKHILDPQKLILVKQLQQLERLSQYIEDSLKDNLTTYHRQEAALIAAIKNQVQNSYRFECPFNLSTKEIISWLEIYERLIGYSKQETVSIAACETARVYDSSRTCDSRRSCGSHLTFSSLITTFSAASRGQFLYGAPMPNMQVPLYLHSFISS